MTDKIVAERAMPPTDLIGEEVRGSVKFLVYDFYAKFNYNPLSVIEYCFPIAVFLYEKHHYCGCNEIHQHLSYFREQVPEVEIREINPSCWWIEIWRKKDLQKIYAKLVLFRL